MSFFYTPETSATPTTTSKMVPKANTDAALNVVETTAINKTSTGKDFNQINPDIVVKTEGMERKVIIKNILCMVLSIAYIYIIREEKLQV